MASAKATHVASNRRGTPRPEISVVTGLHALSANLSSSHPVGRVLQAAPELAHDTVVTWRDRQVQAARRGSLQQRMPARPSQADKDRPDVDVTGGKPKQVGLRFPLDTQPLD